MSEPVTFAVPSGTVTGAWHHPEGGGSDCVILAHGAGGTLHTPQLVAVAEGLAARGIGAVRFNFAYSEAGKRTPDRVPVAQACYRAVAEAVAARASRVFLGGRSFGGRVGSHLAADGFGCAGLVFLAYPLHPPGKPERLRDEHLRAITQPMLFVQGDRDPFAQPDLLDATLRALPRATLHPVTGGDHGHKVRGRPVSDVDAELVSAIADWVTSV